MDPKRDSQKKRKLYRVFAIYAEVPDDDPIIFVGITKMEDLKDLLRYHRNKRGVTREFFEEGIHPEIFLLEETYMKKEVAYQYSIAWGRYFFEKNLDYVVSLNVYEDALDLYGRAKEIYKEISEYPLELVLSRKNNTDPSPKEKKEPEHKHECLTERLSVRITKREADVFSKFCKEHNVTQREGLQLLLANHASKTNYAAMVIVEQNKTIKALEKENAKLKETPKDTQAYKRLNNAFFLQKRL